MATLTKRNGRWTAQIRRRGLKSMSKTFSSKKAAEKWARQVERLIDSAADNDPEKLAEILRSLLSAEDIEKLRNALD